jgi:hypothetical protein
MLGDEEELRWGFTENLVRPKVAPNCLSLHLPKISSSSHSLKQNRL